MKIGDFVQHRASGKVGVIVEQVDTCSRVATRLDFMHASRTWMPAALIEGPTDTFTSVIEKIQVQVELPLKDKEPPGGSDPLEVRNTVAPLPALTDQDLFGASDPRVWDVKK